MEPTGCCGCRCIKLPTQEDVRFSCREKVQLSFAFILISFGAVSFTYSVCKQEHIHLAIGFFCIFFFCILGMSAVFCLAWKYKAHKPAIHLTLVPRVGFTEGAEEVEVQQPPLQLTSQEVLGAEAAPPFEIEVGSYEDFGAVGGGEPVYAQEPTDIEMSEIPFSETVTTAEVYGEPSSVRNQDESRTRLDPGFPRKSAFVLSQEPTAATGTIPKRKDNICVKTKPFKLKPPCHKSEEPEIEVLQVISASDDQEQIEMPTKIQAKDVILEREIDYPKDEDIEDPIPVVRAERYASKGGIKKLLTYFSRVSQLSDISDRSMDSVESVELRTPKASRRSKKASTSEGCELNHLTRRVSFLYHRMADDLNDLIAKGQGLKNLGLAVSFLKETLKIVQPDEMCSIMLMLKKKLKKLKKNLNKDIPPADAFLYMEEWAGVLKSHPTFAADDTIII